jgi:hypothetical protein
VLKEENDIRCNKLLLLSNVFNIFSKVMKTISKDALIVASRQELIDTVLSQVALIDKQQSELQELKFQPDWFKRQVFGTRSEKFIPSDDLQEALDLGIVKETSPEVPAKVITYEKNQRNTKPAHVVAICRRIFPSKMLL